MVYAAINELVKCLDKKFNQVYRASRGRLSKYDWYIFVIWFSEFTNVRNFCNISALNTDPLRVSIGTFKISVEDSLSNAPTSPSTIRLISTAISEELLFTNDCFKISRYDETTGTCKKGDECPFLHRVTGDTERRYHLRYYKVIRNSEVENNVLKTSACIHETDDNRNCEKNGPHCAFGHGHDDLRAPIFDASVGGSGEVEIMERLPNTSEDKVTRFWHDHDVIHFLVERRRVRPEPLQNRVL